MKGKKIGGEEFQKREEERLGWDGGGERDGEGKQRGRKRENMEEVERWRKEEMEKGSKEDGEKRAGKERGKE
jgi:hypothetical protein